jgi:hypothetical protein
MDYAHVAVRQETKWFGNPLLIIEVHFSPAQIELIDRHFLYDDYILSLHHSSWLVRHFIGQPRRQTRNELRLRYDHEGDEWRWDYAGVRENLDKYRWSLIRLSRQPLALPTLRPTKHRKKGTNDDADLQFYTEQEMEDLDRRTTAGNRGITKQ